MDIIYLPGNSLNNKTWIEKVKSNFDTFSTGEILNYDHWQNGQKWINLTQESEKLVKLVSDKEDYFIFAKSIGSVLALKNIYAGTLHPAKIVICGFPYEAGKREFKEIDECLKTLTIPTMFIQNESDPVCSFDNLANTLANYSPLDYHLIKNPDNNTHDYEDHETLTQVVKIYFLER